MGLVGSAIDKLDRSRIDPVAWRAPKAPPLTGVLAPSDELDAAERWQLPTGKGPEDVAVDHDGRVITGSEDGNLWRFDRHGVAELLVNTGGRPLGIEMLSDGRYLVCDTERGVLRVDDKGRIEVLADTAVGKQILACNNSAIGKDGGVYFSDSSDRYKIEDHRYDILEHRANGRLLRLDPKTGESDLLADGLYFANGVGLSSDESFVLVAETGAYQITRVELTGPNAGQVSLWYENLPGIPDNIASQTADGIFWVALYSPRMLLLDLVAPHPQLRRVIANVPESLQPNPVQRGWVLGIDGSANVVHSLQGTKGSYSPVTGVREADGWLYLGSLSADGIARVPAPVRVHA